MRHQVLIIGSGFGGLWACRRLKDADVDVTVVDRTTHHLFQPLLYQVATGILSEGEIAPPFRDIIRRQRNARVVMGEVTDIDLASRTVTAHGLAEELELRYDSLVLAAGARTSYFGHEEFAPYAPGLKSIDDALDLRARIFGAFEIAEVEPDPELRRQWLTFVVVGGGATGVEMAGQIAELSHRALKGNFRAIAPKDCRIVLVDAVDKVLGQFGGKLPEKAARTLEKAGVELMLNTKVTGVDELGIEFDGPQGEHRIEARTKVWGAGVESSPLGRVVAEQAGVEVNRKGQVPVRDDCTLPGHPEVFVVGDLMTLHGLPGVAEVAMQQGRHAGGVIADRVQGNQDFQPFRYLDLGTMASITRFSAVAEVGPIRFGGFIGWLAWLVVHLTFLTGFKNRFSALVHWIVSFLGRSRAERAFTARQFRAERKAPVG